MPSRGSGTRHRTSGIAATWKPGGIAAGKPEKAQQESEESEQEAEALEASVAEAKKNIHMSKGWMYILECSDGSFYTGSTNNLKLRIEQHQKGEGANHTKKRLPVTLVYYEEYSRIDEAFYREKQVQGWSRQKKKALIEGKPQLLPALAIAYRDLRNKELLTQ